MTRMATSGRKRVKWTTGATAPGSGGGGGAAGEIHGTWATFHDLASNPAVTTDAGTVWSVYLGDEGNAQTVTEYPGGVNRIFSVQTSAVGGFYLYFQTRTASGYDYPAGHAQGRCTTPGIAWNQVNRLQFLMKLTQAVPRRADGGSLIELGTFIRDPEDPDTTGPSAYEAGGGHYYHIYDPNIPANDWIAVVIDRHPQHKRQAPAGDNYADDVEFANSGYHYFDSLTNFYWDSQGANFNGSYNVTVKDFCAGIVPTTGTEDYDTASFTFKYNTTDSRYEIEWAGLKGTAVTYEVRYSTASMKTNGFTSGTDAGTTTNPASDYTGCQKTISMAESATGIYIAVRKQGATAFREFYVPYRMGTT